MTPRRRSLAKFSDQLRDACAAEWRAAHVEHLFVRAMGDGTLSLERFQFFMRQDYLFLIAYCRALGLATAKCPDLESMGWWAKLLDETLNSEMDLHRSFCADFGITAAQLEATVPAPATVAYTSHLLRTAHEDSIAVIAAAFLPCQWGYDDIGRALAGRPWAKNSSFRARWIAGYNAPEYRKLTAWLRRSVDRLGADAGAGERERMFRAFRTSTGHELAFWDQAWRSSA